MNLNREEALFQLALNKLAAKRAALRQRIEALLATHEQPDENVLTS